MAGAADTFQHHHLTVVEGIQVTTVARTVFDLARVLHPVRTERALDNALARNLTSIRSLSDVAAELAEHGRTGSTLMRELLGIRRFTYVPAESGVEARFLEVLEEAGIELPERQVDRHLRTGGGGAHTWCLGHHQVVRPPTVARRRGVPSLGQSPPGWRSGTSSPVCEPPHRRRSSKVRRR